MLDLHNTKKKFLNKIRDFYSYKRKLWFSIVFFVISLFIFIPQFTLYSTANSQLPAQTQLGIEEEINPLISFFPVGLGPFSVTTTDLDGDAKADLITANLDANTLSLLRNTSTICAINFAPQITFPTGIRPSSVIAGDIDGDGKTDLAVANIISNTVSVLRNTSSAGVINFAPQVTFPTVSNPTSGVVSDLDGDGKLDLAIVNIGDNSVSVLRNASSIGTISFAPQIPFSVGSSPRSVAAGDVDGDGKIDLAIANFNSNTVSVLRNISSVGVISFAPQVTFPTSSGPIAVSIGELNNDGKLDLVATNFNSNTVSALRNTSSIGAISFAPQNTFPTATSPNSVAIGDLDKDGKFDLAITNQTNATVSAFRNISTVNSISFATKVDFPAGLNPISASLSDLNADGKLDFAFASRGDSSASALRNTSGVTHISFDEAISALPASLPSGQVEVGYSQALSGINGSAPYSFSLVSGSLPLGLGVLPSGGIFGTPTSAGTFSFTIQVTDSNGCSGNTNYTLSISGSAGKLSFSVSATSVQEGGATAITVTRTKGSTGAVSVSYNTNNGTALAGTHYVDASGTLSFANQDTSPKTFTVQTIANNLFEANRNFRINLSNAMGGASVELSTISVEIIEKDTAQPGQFSFSQSSYVVDETAGIATISVNRAGGSNVRVSVNYTVSAGANAEEGVNFFANNGSLVFSPNITSQSFVVPIVNDRKTGENKIVNLALSGATNGAAINGATATLTIIESTPPPKPPMLQADAAIDFGLVNIGDTARRTVTLSNSGELDLIFMPPMASGDGISVVTVPPITKLAANQSTTFEVEFKPLQNSLLDNITGSIFIMSNGGSVNIPIVGKTIDNVAPKVTFTSFSGGDVVAAGTSVRIRYDASDNDVLNDFRISFSSSVLAGDIARVNSSFREIVWNVPNDLESNGVQLIVVARDRAGNISIARSGQFSVIKVTSTEVMLQTLIRFTPPTPGQIAPPTNVTATAVQIKNNIPQAQTPILLMQVFSNQVFSNNGVSNFITNNQAILPGIKPLADEAVIEGYNIYRTFQPPIGPLPTPEDIIKPENLIGSIPSTVNTFTDKTTANGSGNFVYTVSTFFGNGQMSGGSQPAATDLPIVKNPRFEGKSFFVDSAASFIKLGATLIINEVESYNLEFDDSGTRFTTRGNQGNPSGLTIDRLIRKGNSVSLTIKNPDGKLSVAVMFTRK